jgi:hypothetical protein
MDQSRSLDAVLGALPTLSHFAVFHMPGSFAITPSSSQGQIEPLPTDANNVAAVTFQRTLNTH